MSNFTYSQIAALKRRHIIVRVERQDGIVVCWDHGNERIYTIEDLRTMAEPGVVERLRDWIAGLAKEAA
ncbi:MAG TPA: hypothetical protein VFM75_12895 [Modicisalibacter sp.]|nr:hypothetical protein [Modicisalibacter sp.]